jgi:hypothetical protein
VLGKRRLDARDEITAIGCIVGMLQLAAAALRKMAARRLLVMRPGRQRTVVEQSIAGNPERNVAAALRHSVAARGDPDDQLMRGRQRSFLFGQLPASSSASASA